MYNAERQRTGLGLPEAPVYFALAPLFHITGMVCQLAACLDSAGTLVLAYRFEAGVVLDAFAEHRPAYTVGPSTAFMALAAHPGRHAASTSPPSGTISSGGAPRAARPRREVPGRLRPVHPQRLRTHRVHRPLRLRAARPGGPRRPRLRDAGRRRARAPTRVVRIVDDQGQEVPFGEQGEIARTRPAGRARLLAPPRRHRRDLPGRRTAHRRHRLHGRRRLALRGRPQEGHDQRVRLQGVAARGRGRPLHAPRGARGGRRRGPRRLPRRDRQGVRQPAPGRR